MPPTRPRTLAPLLPMALAALLGPASAGLAQATKARVEPPPAGPNAKAAGPVDLNSATAEELAALPGIGDAFARRIIEGRPHRAVADLARAGIPATTVDGLGPRVAVRPLPPAVDINEDPADRLQSLPGVGPVMAREIIAGRPYAKYDDLGRVKGLGPKTLDGLRGRLKFGKAGAEPEPRAGKPAEPRPAAEPKAKKPAEARPAPRPSPEPRAPATPVLAPGAKVNLNKATKEELDALPGIGEFYSQAIIDARPFSKIEDVMKIKGIKEVEFGKIKDRITVK